MILDPETLATNAKIVAKIAEEIVENAEDIEHHDETTMMLMEEGLRTSIEDLRFAVGQVKV